ncbi:MAG: thiol-disulfide oxidoreductase DCC family protein [Pseudomonadota bacterium]
MKLRVFYDGSCPLCAAEMKQLMAADRDGQVELQDISRPDFAERFPHIDPVQADRILHGETDDGTRLYGLDVTVRAWSLAGKGWRVNWLRWPVIRPVADRVYLFFARHRHRISRLLTGKSRCDVCG